MSVTEQSPAETFIQDVLERLDVVGDLPIFSASVARIQSVGSDPDSNAMGLAVEVLKDANLTTKILKLANSTYYSRGRSKLSTLSRAIVLLGFDMIKSTVLTMKLIDSFKTCEGNGEVENLLVRSYMSAALTRQLAEVSGIKKPEETYICGLLHKLGQIVLHATMPEKYEKVQKTAEKDSISFDQAGKKILPMSVYQIGQAVAEHWEFPKSTLVSMQPRHGQFSKNLKNNSEQFNSAVSALTAEMMELLYLDNPGHQTDFTGICQELGKVCGVSQEQITQSLVNAFNQSIDLAENYGLNKVALAPKAQTSYGNNDEMRNTMAELLRETASVDYAEDEHAFIEDDEEDGYDLDAVEVTEQQSAPSVIQGNSNTLLSVIQQISTLISQRASLNSVFNKVIQGMVDGLGMDRAILCLMSPDRAYYNGRIAYGAKSDDLRHIFHQRRVDSKNDIFSKVMLDGDELWVKNINADEYRNLLTADIKQQLHANEFLLVALTAHDKPMGFFYADCAKSKAAFSKEIYRNFIQLVGQAQLALSVR